MSEEQEAPELLPCPFCGGEAERQTLPDDEFGNGNGDVITCGQCLASSHVEFGYKENLVSAWNRRAELAATHPAASVDREALVKAAQAVVARWDSIDWKAPPTAEVMNQLRAALASIGRQRNG